MIPDLSKQQLRTFGILTGVIIIILFGILFPWLRQHLFPIWPWGIALILWCLALLSPTALRPIYKVWMRVGLVLGFINTRIILGVVFYGLLLPMGLIMRLVRQDPMNRIGDKTAETYLIPGVSRTRESMENPY